MTPAALARSCQLARASKSARWSGAGPTCQASARVRLVGLRRAADAIQLLAEAVVVGPRRAEAVNAPAVARLSRACARVPESEVWAPGHVACALLACAPVRRGIAVLDSILDPCGRRCRRGRRLTIRRIGVGLRPEKSRRRCGASPSAAATSPGAAATSPGADVARHGSSPWGEPLIQLRTAETALCETRHATRTVRRAAEPVLKPGGPTRPSASVDSATSAQDLATSAPALALRPRPSASVDSASGRCLPCCLLPIHT